MDFNALNGRFDDLYRHLSAGADRAARPRPRRIAPRRRPAGAVHQRFDALNGRFDDLYRHLPGPGTQTGQPGPAPAAG